MNQAKFRKWQETTLKDILMFSTDYGQPVDWNSKPKYTGKPLGPEEALYVFECEGVNTMDTCLDPESLVELLQHKDGMNLSVAGWKEEINDHAKACFVEGDRRSIDVGYQFICAVVLALVEEYGNEFLEKVGIKKLQMEHFSTAVCLREQCPEWREGQC